MRADPGSKAVLPSQGFSKGFPSGRPGPCVCVPPTSSFAAGLGLPGWCQAARLSALSPRSLVGHVALLFSRPSSHYPPLPLPVYLVPLQCRVSPLLVLVCQAVSLASQLSEADYRGALRAGTASGGLSPWAWEASWKDLATQLEAVLALLVNLAQASRVRCLLRSAAAAFLLGPRT